MKLDYKTRVQEIKRMREERKKEMVEKYKELSVKKEALVAKGAPKCEEKCEHGHYMFEYRVDMNLDEMSVKWEKVKLECEECNRLAMLNSKLKIPERYKLVKPSDEYYQEYKKRNGIIFAGDVGVGKTYALIGLLKYVSLNEKLNDSDLSSFDSYTGINYGDKMDFHTGTEIASMLRNAVGNDTLYDVVQRLKECRVLVIDDLGTESATDFMLENLYGIINDRYNEMKPVMITTNLSSTDFVNAYGQRTISRLQEMGQLVKLKGKDKRAGFWSS